MKKYLAFLLILLLLPAFAVGETLTLSFVGDCSLGETIESQGSKEGFSWMVDKNGLDWPFSTVRKYLDADDFTFANLEVVFTTRSKHKDKRTNLRAKPYYAQVLLHSGVDAVNTVNNHSFDFNYEGYMDTLKALDEIGFKHFGSVYVNSKYGSDLLLETEVKGIKIGAVGFSYPQESDLKIVKQRIQKLKDAGCDIIVASMHWGQETKPTQTSEQMKFARELIKAGADIIWGHHPHVLQPVQFYKGGIVMHSTGNLTFGSMSSKVDRDTGIFQVTFDISGKDPVMTELKVIPFTTTGRGDYRPKELTEEADRLRVFKKVRYAKKSETMTNLPESFLKTGVVKLKDGMPVE
ncbi:MAG: CapA family protein [Clostridia bacterium]|nr:CapA family protein [Clostridia bacterium]